MQGSLGTLTVLAALSVHTIPSWSPHEEFKRRLPAWPGYFPCQLPHLRELSLPQDDSSLGLTLSSIVLVLEGLGNEAEAVICTVSWEGDSTMLACTRMGWAGKIDSWGWRCQSVGRMMA